MADLGELQAREAELEAEMDAWTARAPDLRQREAELEEDLGEAVLDGDEGDAESLEEELAAVRRELARGEAAQSAREKRLEDVREKREAVELQARRDRYNGLRSAQSKTVRQVQETADELAGHMDTLMARAAKISDEARHLPEADRQRLGSVAAALQHWIADNLRPSEFGGLFKGLNGLILQRWRGRSLPALLRFADDTDDRQEAA